MSPSETLESIEMATLLCMRSDMYDRVLEYIIHGYCMLADAAIYDLEQINAEILRRELQHA